MNESAKKPTTVLKESEHRYRVILAEDTLPNILTISEYLESHGYEAIVAQHGLEVIEKADKIRPDIILMETQMLEIR